MGCLVEVVVPGAPGPGVVPPAGVPMSAIFRFQELLGKQVWKVHSLVSSAHAQRVYVIAHGARELCCTDLIIMIVV